MPLYMYIPQYLKFFPPPNILQGFATSDIANDQFILAIMTTRRHLAIRMY